MTCSLRAGGTTFRLGDVADVKRGYEDPPQVKMRFNGKEVIGLGVSMEKGGDIIALGKSAGETVGRHQSASCRSASNCSASPNQPEVVTASVSEFVHTLIEAVLIVLAVSFVSLGLHRKPLPARRPARPGRRADDPAGAGDHLPGHELLDIDLHKISLGALIIALGLLVDDAIIAVEMMVRKMEQGMSRFDAATFAYTSTAFPMLTGTLITAAGFLPIGLAKSAAGEYTFSIFSVNALALLISWVVAVSCSRRTSATLLLKVKPAANADGHHELFDTPFYERFRRHRQLVRGVAQDDHRADAWRCSCSACSASGSSSSSSSRTRAGRS